MSIKLIVGLRNPGNAYQHTRHNAGGWFLEALTSAHHASFKVEKKWHAELANVVIASTPIFCMLPLTFMNQSGIATRAISQFYQIAPEQILVVHDELDLPVGRMKLKTGGGHGGHNGLRDIIQQLGSTNFHRLRIGIGHPGQKELVHDYVLGKPSQSDLHLIIKAIDQAMAVMPTLIEGNMASAMNIINGQ